jgi:hypothetical protein
MTLIRQLQGNQQRSIKSTAPANHTQFPPIASANPELTEQSQFPPPTSAIPELTEQSQSPFPTSAIPELT